MNLFGLEVERKTDVLALFAFLIAVTGTGLQIAGWLRGPQVSFFTPDRVVFYPYEQSGGAQFMRVAAIMSYTNTAPPAYAANLRRETVTFHVADVRSHQAWSSFGKLRRTETGFLPEIDVDAAPLPIAGGEAVSHTTFFAPTQRPCAKRAACDPTAEFVDWRRFTSALTGDPITLEFRAEFYKGAALSRTCEVVPTELMITQWLTQRWFSAPCTPVDRSWGGKVRAWLGMRDEG